MRKLLKCYPVAIFCLAAAFAFPQSNPVQPSPPPSPSPAPSPTPSPQNQQGQNAEPAEVQSVSSSFTSPISGKPMKPGGPEDQAYADLMNRYQLVQNEQAYLTYLKACGSAEDVKKQELRLAKATAAFNQSLENYLYAFFNLNLENNAPMTVLLPSASAIYGPKQRSSQDGSTPAPRTPQDQSHYDNASNDVMAQLAKDTKPPSPPASCPTVPVMRSPAPPKPHPAPGGESDSGSVKTLIGIVLPADAQPGDTLTASLVKDPQSYAGIPGLRVVPATVPLATDAQGEASLSGLIVDTGDGQEQPATGRLRLHVPKIASQITLTINSIGNETALDKETVPLAAASPAPNAQIWEPSKALQIPATAYTTAPAEDGGAVQAIHGPVSGDSISTQVLVDNKPASIVAESPRAAYFDLPEDAAPGAHKITVAEDGQLMASFHVAVLDLKLSAKDLRLIKNQSTQMEATVSGESAIDDSAWKPGLDSDLVAPTTASELLPEKAGSSRPAAIVLQIQNKSPETIKLVGAKANTITLPLEQKNFTNGTYTASEKIQSIRSGTFNIRADVIPLLAPISGEVPTQTEQTETITKRSTVTMPALSALPAVKPPAKPTALELSHIDAYYVASTHTLHVWNAKHFLQGIESGRFLAMWNKGATKATLRDAEGSAIGADVSEDDPDDDYPLGPEIGDTKFVENQKIVSHAQEFGDCSRFQKLGGKVIGDRGVYRQYNYLADDGKDSGTETYLVTARRYEYEVKDCSAGYSGSADIGNEWVLSVSAWPNP